jgi:hypothetical protein
LRHVLRPLQHRGGPDACWEAYESWRLGKGHPTFDEGATVMHPRLGILPPPVGGGRRDPALGGLGEGRWAARCKFCKVESVPVAAVDAARA